MMQNPRHVLVTGATGYVGGRLVAQLLDQGHRVRVMTRDQRHLAGRTWLDQVDVVEADVCQRETLYDALDGVDVAYYLIHSLEDADYQERDRQAAQNFAQVVNEMGTARIIYLGGLGHDDEALSDHLSSRHEVGQILRDANTTVIEFRAAIVVGSGSVSFEMIRYLTQRLPVMLCPSWLYTRTQPIAIEDVLDYLCAALYAEVGDHAIVQIGGADVLTYRDMMLEYADLRGLRRFLIPVPLLVPTLSSYWIYFFTPISLSIIKPLVQSLENEVTVEDDTAQRLFPHIQPMTYRQALARALDELDANQVETTWTDSMTATWEEDEPYTFVEERGMFIERRKRTTTAPAQAVYRSFSMLGGESGWLYLNWLWRIRGTMDRAVGGVGHRRGRRDPEHLRVGDAVDFWRVETVEPGSMIRLRAEMKLPGRGWLQFNVETTDTHESIVTQTAYFAPHGLLGYLYWYSLFILHKFIFDGMLDRVVARAEAMPAPEAPPEDEPVEVPEAATS